MEGIELLNIFKEHKFDYFTGVPDSTFKGFINELYSADGITHRLAVNECEAAFLAGGYYVSTGKIGVCYMQNAGLGKVVNPITSYTTPYSIPMLLLIGWRGEPEPIDKDKDEPQHIHMGDIMLRLLGLLKIPFDILSNDLGTIKAQVRVAKEYMELNKKPYALIVRRRNSILPGTKFSAMDEFFQGEKGGKISRADVVKGVVHNMKPEDIIVSTTGKVSRELYDLRADRGEGHGKDFLNVGGMGGALAQATEIALQHPDRKVYCIDGDGAALMQLGSMATAGHYHPRNLIHVLIDNGGYQSTGNQPGISDSLHFCALAITCGYKVCGSAYFYKQFYEYLEDFKKGEGPFLVVVHCGKYCSNKLGRPRTSPQENKRSFMENLGVK